MLSPTNKTGEGYWDYQAKRRKLIRQNVHLVELDLLVRGQRLPMERELPRADFYAFVSRADRRPNSDVFAWSIRQPLPKIPIPLHAPDPDVILDLPALFAIGYDRGRYARALDYSAPLDLPAGSGRSYLGRGPCPQGLDLRSFARWWIRERWIGSNTA